MTTPAVRSIESLMYTPPGGSLTTIPFTTSSEALEQEVGQQGIPIGAPIATQYQVNFGSVAHPTYVRVVNNTDQRLDLQIGADDAPDCGLAPGGSLKIEMPVPASANDIPGIWYKTSAEVTVEQRVACYVFGDPHVED